MAYATSSDPVLQVVLGSGMVVMALSAGMLLAIALLRMTSSRHQAREQFLIAQWPPYFFCAIEQLPVNMPRLAGRDRKIVLKIWVQLMESLRGEAQTHLRRLALELKLHRTARKLLAQRAMSAQLLGVVALGRLKCHDSWGILLGLLANPNPMISLMAGRSLLQIDPTAGTGVLVNELARRQDWPIRNVASILAEADQRTLSQHLIRIVRSAGAQKLPQLLRLLVFVENLDTWTVLEPLLDENQPTDVLVAALRVLRDVRGIELVRLLSAHEQWPVRAQAATTLGRLNSPDDVARLHRMLRDREWWVRYRAATALATHPSVSKPQLYAWSNTTQDAYGSAILKHVLAENGADLP